jgi:hypothetical protein
MNSNDTPVRNDLRFVPKWAATESFRFRILPMIGMLLLAPAYWIYVFAPGVGNFHDDGIYLVTAQSLAQGSGYRIVSLPSEIPQTKYPILYPAVLSLLIRIFPSFPANVPMMKALSLLFTVLWCVASFKLLENTYAAKWRWWILLFTLACPSVIVLSTAILPDTLFAFVSMAAVLLLTRIASTPGASNLANVVWAGLLCGLAFLTRSAGLPLILAGLVILVRNRMYFKSAIFAAVCALICIPWLYWQKIQPGPADTVLAYYSKLSYEEGSIFGHYNPSQLGQILLTNAISILASFFKAMGGRTPGILGSIAVWVVIAGGLLRSLRAGLSVITAWVLFYLSMLLCWVFYEARYEAPLVPLLLGLFVEGLRFGSPADTRTALRRRYLVAGLVSVFVLLAGTSVWTISRETLRKGVASNTPALDTLEWKEIMGLTKWIEQNTSRDAIVSADLDPVFYLYAQRKAIRPYRSDFYTVGYEPDRANGLGTVEQLREHILRNKIGYVVLTPDYGYIERIRLKLLVDRLISLKPDAFRIVDRRGNGEYLIYAVDSARL